jgi:hypothetical protein
VPAKEGQGRKEEAHFTGLKCDTVRISVWETCIELITMATAKTRYRKQENLKNYLHTKMVGLVSSRKSPVIN